MESKSDRSQIDHQELPDESSVPQTSDRASSAQITQNVQGDRNVVIAQMLGGTVIGNVETLIQQVQHQPCALSLHQLPSDTADFTGRQTEIERITALLQQGSKPSTAKPIAVLSGMAGVGKSTLAIHIAYQIQPQFPDIQLYINLQGAEAQPLEPAEVLASWLRSFGMDDANIPAELSERSALYRSQMAGKQALVVLDNAQSEIQVRPLLPGSPTCRVLVTSRRRLAALEGAQIFDLAVMSEEEAQELLEKLVGSERIQTDLSSVARILALCGKLPLAIRIAGGTLRQKPHWRLDDYASKLSNEQHRLEQLQLSDLDVRASFILSYQQLAADAVHLFGLLGLMPSRAFPKEIAAVLLEMEPVVAETALQQLLDAQLLEVVDQYQCKFHDLIRLFAQEQLAKMGTTEVQNVAKQRVIRWYLEEAGKWNIVFHPLRQITQEWELEDGTSIELEEQFLFRVGIEWFENERFNLLSVLDWANQTGAYEQVIDLVESLNEFLEIRSYWVDAKKINLIALEATRKLGDRRGEGHVLKSLGDIYGFLKQLPESISYYEQSLKAFNDTTYPSAEEGFQRRDQGMVLVNLGNTYRAQGQVAKAKSYYEQGLEISKAIGNPYDQGTTLNNLGNIYRDQEAWQEAVSCYEQSLEKIRDRGAYRLEGTVLTNLGKAYNGQKQWKKAISYLQQSFEIFHRLGDRQGEGECLEELGYMYLSQGRWESAIDAYEQLLEICRESGNVYGEGVFLMYLGLSYQKRKQPERAIALWQEALTKFDPDSPMVQRLSGMLQAAQKPYQLGFLGWLLPLSVLLFLGWNLINGHWLIASLGVLALIGWQWFRRRR